MASQIKKPAEKRTEKINSHQNLSVKKITPDPMAIQEERRMRIKNIFKRGYKELYGILLR